MKTDRRGKVSETDSGTGRPLLSLAKSGSPSGDFLQGNLCGSPAKYLTSAQAER